MRRVSLISDLIPDYRYAGSVPLYHGTTRENLTHILPGSTHNKGLVFPQETDGGYAYATPNLQQAWNYAEKAWNANSTGIPRVYQVESINGDEEKDPTEDQYGHSRGNWDADLRSKGGFKVHHEMPMPEDMGNPEDWQ